MHINISLKADQLKGSLADLYIVVQNPDGSFTFYQQKRRWKVKDIEPVEVAAISLKKFSSGPYSLNFILCQSDHDLFNFEHWIASATTQVTILPYRNNPASIIPCEKAGGYPPVLVAHAGGEFEGRTGTNTREALNYNYTKGHRFFEVDFSWTSDGHLILIHDWQTTFNSLFEDNASGRPTFDQFNSKRMKHGLTQMSLQSLYSWLSGHRHARIITDVKNRNLEALKIIAATAGNLKQRFIPQIYALNEYRPVSHLGFSDIILTLYQTTLTDVQVIDFVSGHDLFGVTMPVRHAFRSSLAKELRQKGVWVYTHTVNQPMVLDYLKKLGVHGIYTDKITPAVIFADRF